MDDLLASRPVKAGDKLATTKFENLSTCGFAAVGKPEAAVRLLPGTELGFDNDIRYYNRFSLLRFCVSHKTARFRQFSINGSDADHDALEFPDGRIVMLSELAAGQTATVMQVPPRVPGFCLSQPHRAPKAGAV